MSGFRPMKTLYNGRWYRSTIEARYAVLFDAIGVRWEYEPQGYRLPKNGPYLPDFRVRTCGRLSNCFPCEHLIRDPHDTSEEYQADGWLYIEVKSDLFDADLSKCFEFSRYRDAIACGAFTTDWYGRLCVQLVACGDADMMCNYGLEECENGPWLGMDDGKLGVCYPDSSQDKYRLPDEAYLFAMNYQFDHRMPVVKGGAE